MGEEIRNYLTPKEIEQLDSLIKKAEERRKEEGKSEKSFLLLKCQCDCAKCLSDGEPLKEEMELMNDLEKILHKLCRYCSEYECHCIIREAHSDDREELPFES